MSFNQKHALSQQPKKFFIGFNRKWTSSHPCQRKLAVFGSLFYTCMLVKTQLFFFNLENTSGNNSIRTWNLLQSWKQPSFLFISFTSVKKNTTQLELIRNEVKPGQSCLLFDTFPRQIVANGRLRVELLEIFVLFSSQPSTYSSVSSLSIIPLIIDQFYSDIGRAETGKNYCSMYFPLRLGTAAKKTNKQLVCNEQDQLNFCPIITLKHTHTQRCSGQLQNQKTVD